MAELETAFDLGDHVNIVAINVNGRIDCIEVDSSGISYRVIYWNNCERYSVWMHEWEIEKYARKVQS